MFSFVPVFSFFAALSLLGASYSPSFMTPFPSLLAFKESSSDLLDHYFDADLADRRRVFHQQFQRDQLAFNQVSELSVTDIKSVVSFTCELLTRGLTSVVTSGYEWCMKERNDDFDALFAACFFSNLSSLQALLERVVKEEKKVLAEFVNSRNGSGETVLMLAAKDGFVHVIRCLLEAGADPRLTNILGNSAIIYAARIGNVMALEEFRLSFPELDFNATGDMGRTPMIVAAYHGNLEVLQFLLSQPGINVNWQDSTGATALMVAASVGRLGFVEALLLQKERFKVSLNLQDTVGETALHRAAYSERLQVVRTLLFAGADPIILNRSGLAAHQVVRGMRTPVSTTARLIRMYLCLRLAALPGSTMREELCWDVLRNIARFVRDLALSMDVLLSP